MANEITDDVDPESPAVDHNPAFKDQFVYFGAKRYKSRRRHLEKKEDPYKKFWTTGQLNSPAPRSQVGKEAALVLILRKLPRAETDCCMQSVFFWLTFHVPRHTAL